MSFVMISSPVLSRTCLVKHQISQLPAPSAYHRSMTPETRYAKSG